MRSLGLTAWIGLSLGALVLLSGCGADAPSCSGGGLTLQVSPAAATADHMAAAPGNEVRFSGSAIYAAGAPGCAVPALALLEYASWTNPDPVHIQISSASDPTNGTAVCLGATTGAVTLAGVFAPVGSSPAAKTSVKTVQLTCK